MSIKGFVLQFLLFGITAGIVFWVIHDRFEKSDAIYHDDLEILLYDEINLDGLIHTIDSLNVQFDIDEFTWAANRLDRQNFRPGRYLLKGGMSYNRFLGKLGRGEEDPKMVMIHPGQTYELFYRRVANQFRFTRDELRAVMTDKAYIESELGIESHLLFGRMIPNTYEFFWTTTPEGFLERMLREFDRAIAPHADKMDEVNLTPDEVLTFASIVELEARYDHEKPKIAGLYWNRLNQRWRLQADPTVSYAVGERRRLFFRDYRVDHPYNTYRIHGLPPGPLTNPAMSSIRAVLNPDEHDYMFMVATPEGVHTFTRTYAEHRAESAKWSQWISEQQRIRQQREREEQRLAQLRSATL